MNDPGKLLRANAILKDASVYFRAGARPDSPTMTRYVEERRVVFGVEPTPVTGSGRCSLGSSDLDGAGEPRRSARSISEHDREYGPALGCAARD
jgi:hypothetical protein